MNPILVLDFNSPIAYDPFLLEQRTIGGTEGSIIRIAQKLGEKIAVVVAQRVRKHTTVFENVSYVSITENILLNKWHAVVVIRNCGAAIECQPKFKDTPMWVWFHDLIRETHFPFFKSMCDNNIGSIFVSDFHRSLMLKLCSQNGYSPPSQIVKRIYNPIDDDLQPDSTPINKNQLIFASSAMKGLNDTIETFKLLRKRNKEFELLVTDPGYCKSEWKPSQNVKYIGALTHNENIQFFRKAFCLFYINRVYPETFGLVLAEANAVGTPVLTHPLGAAPEVLGDSRQYMDTNDANKVADRIMEWYETKRPIIKGRDEFRLTTVCKEWSGLLGLQV